ncbi:VanZ family protein [Methylorubrum extorquens]
MNFDQISRLARLATPIAVLAIAVLSWLPGSQRPHTGASGQVEHAVAYALTAAGIVVGFPQRILAIALASIGVAAVLEIGQLWIPGRTSQVIDFLASAGGAIVGLTITYLVCSRWTSQRPHRSV